MTKHVFWKRIFLVLTVFVTLFIFSQSLMSRAASSGESAQVMGKVQRLLLWLNWNVDSYKLHVFVRKAAHFVEFSALGICAGGYAVNLGRINGRKYIAMPAWLTLMIAVCDEFIQVFSGRAGMVEDVVLDYCGALFGLMIVALYVRLQSCKEKMEQSNLS